MAGWQLFDVNIKHKNCDKLQKSGCDSEGIPPKTSD